MPHFGSWPVENRALIPQTVDFVPVIKPYLFLCFQSFVSGSGFVLPLPSSAFLFFFSLLFISMLFCFPHSHQGKKRRDFNSWGASNQSDFPWGTWASLRPLIQGPDVALERVLHTIVPVCTRGCTQLCTDAVPDAARG